MRMRAFLEFNCCMRVSWPFIRRGMGSVRSLSAALADNEDPTNQDIGKSNDTLIAEISRVNFGSMHFAI